MTGTEVLPAGPAAPTAIEVMYSLVLEDGRRWGEAASDFQVADVEAIFDSDGAPWHYLTRPRGGSKTTDTAGVALSWLVAEAPPGYRGFVLAISEDQAGELIEAASGFVDRTPGLGDLVTVEATTIYADNGAYVKVLTAGESTWGKGARTGLIILDEFAQWPETRRMLRVWKSMLSATQKTPGLRFILLTSAGEPGHFSYSVLKIAKTGRYKHRWRVSEMPGPVPWVDLEAVRAQEEHMSDAEFDRLHMNIWTEAEDVVVTREDLDNACVLKGKLPPKAGRRYLITVDLGVKIDPTVIVVSHTEKGEKAKRVVVDHLVRLVPRRGKQVRLAGVEKMLLELSQAYNRAPVHGDPSQFHQMRQNLEAAGVRVKEFKFTPTSVGEVGSALVLSLRNGQVELPDDAALRDELLHVRLRETSPGVYRLDHGSNRHDDQAVATGMAVHLHLGRRAGTAGYMKFMRDQIAERADPEREAERDRRAMARALRNRRGAPGRRRQQRQARCEHIWRAGSDLCMWGCGATRGDAAA